MPIKVLHCAMMARPFVGIVNQMRWEHSAARKLGLSWDVRIFCPEPLGFNEGHVPSRKFRLSGGRFPSLVNWVWIRVQYAMWLLRTQRSYDIVLMRYSSYDPFQALLSSLLRKKVLTVHHTIETVELSSFKTMLAKIQALAELVLGAITLSFGRGIIGVTGEITRYEKGRALAKSKPGLVYSNGVVYDEASKPDPASKLASRQPGLLFVASTFYPWQGLDLLLESVSASSESFRLHVVGAVNDELREGFTDSRIIYHGMLTSAQIEALAVDCTIGIAPLALSRKGMREACPLKVREYLRSGLPVYGGYTDVFPDDFPYFVSGPADIDSILKFANRVSGVCKVEVSAASRPYLDKEVLLGRIYAGLSSLHAAGKHSVASAGCGRAGG